MPQFSHPLNKMHCKTCATRSVTDCNEDTRNPFFFPFKFNMVLSEQLEHQFVRIDSI